MTVKVLAAHVHVQDEDGNPVLLLPGTEVPAEYAGQVTNPACFIEVEADEAVVVTVTAAAAQSDASVEVVEVATVEPVAPVAPVVAVASGPAPLAPADYADAAFKALQVEAKRRGLSGVGKAETLIARLEADDREAGNAPAPTDETVPAVEPATDQPQF